MRRPLRLVAAAAGLAVALSSGQCQSVRAQPTAPGVISEPVCLAGQVGADQVELFGVRYHVGPVTAGRRTIVLVHGVDSSHDVWDFPPGYSVARDLAGQGYVVVAYDQPGFGNSQINGPQAGDRITTEDLRVSLHHVVQQLRAGTYTQASGDSCAEPRRAVAAPSASVVIMGHSLGGLVVSGYAGTYHDVDGVVQIDADNFGFSPAFYEHLVGVGTAVGTHPTDDHFRIFLSPADCRQFLVYPPGIDPSLLPGLCDLSHRTPSPNGVGVTTAALIPLNLLAIANTGPRIPVLLVFADHETAFDPSARPTEVRYWQDHCGCNVTSWVQPDTGHAFMWHRSLPLFIERVTNWMAEHHLEANRLAVAGRQAVNR